MLTNSTTLLICAVVILASTVIVLSNNLPNLIIVTEYVNFLVFPALVFLATATNNPYNLLLIIPVAVFSAIEVILASAILFYNIKN